MEVGAYAIQDDIRSLVVHSVAFAHLMSVSLAFHVVLSAECIVRMGLKVTRD